MRSSLAHTGCTSLEMAAWWPSNIPDSPARLAPEAGLAHGQGYLPEPADGSLGFVPGQELGGQFSLDLLTF